jgi:hypothetical protein
MYTTFTVKKYPKIFDDYVIKKTTQSKESPKRRKLAQSGHATQIQALSKAA